MLQTVTNNVPVTITVGEMVVIGNDLSDYDIAHVERILRPDEEVDDYYIDVTYYEPDLKTRALKTMKRPGKKGKRSGLTCAVLTQQL